MRSLADSVFFCGLRILGEERHESARSRTREKNEKKRRVIKLISISVEEKLSAHFERLEEKCRGASSSLRGRRKKIK